MIGLIASDSVAAASSSCFCDQEAHLASFWRTSSRTLVSTRTINLAASKRQNLFRTHAYRRAAAKLGEFAHLGFCVCLGGLECDLPSLQAFEGDGLARFQAKIVTHLFRHGDLAFAGEVRCHGSVTPCYLSNTLPHLGL